MTRYRSTKAEVQGQKARVLAQLAQKQGLSKSDLGATTHLLMSMVKEGLIVKQGIRAGTRYYLPENTAQAAAIINAAKDFAAKAVQLLIPGVVPDEATIIPEEEDPVLAERAKEDALKDMAEDEPSSGDVVYLDDESEEDDAEDEAV